MLWLILTTPFILVHGPDGQPIELHTKAIVSLREVRAGTKEHFAKGTKCIVSTIDGKYVTAVETCREIDKLINESK